MTDIWIEFFKWVMIMWTPCGLAYAGYIKWLQAKLEREKLRAKENALSSMQVYEMLTNYYAIRDKLKEMELSYQKQEFKTEQMEKLIADIKESVSGFQEKMLEYFQDRTKALEQIVKH